MKINGNSYINFKSAQVNILAMADNHGNVHNLPQLVKTVEDNKQDIFKKSDDKSTLNVFAIAGDFFMNPHKKGFMTTPNLSNGDIQAKFLDKVVNTIKKITPNNFEAIYALGNHCFDGGDEFVFNKLKDEPVKTIISNVNLEKSPLVSNLMKDHKNIVQSQVFEVPDDKNPDLKHDVLFLGVTIPSVKSYLKQTELYDNSNKKDLQIKEEDLQKTFEVLNNHVKTFKDKCPKGAVVVLSHTGAPISKMIEKNVSDINVILNGHDHTRDNEKNGKTLINSLGKDNEIIKSINLKFDDDGILQDAEFKMFETQNSGRNEEVQAYLNENFEKDMQPLVKMHGEKELIYDDKIRYSNTLLTNYLTSTVKEEAQKSYKDLDCVALQSSYIRGGIKEGSTNLNLMKIFDGANIESQNLNIGKVKGEDLINVVSENILNNLKSPTRNTIIQWSDMQIDRTLMEEISKNKSDKKFSDAIKMRNPETNEFEAIVTDKEYTLILPDKLLQKKDLPCIQKVREDFTSINKTYDDFFRANLETKNFEIEVTDKIREERIK